MSSRDGGLVRERDQLAIATRLAGCPVALFPIVRSGRNSRVYRVETAEYRFALKLYPAPLDSRDRLYAEVKALRFLEVAGVANVPRVIALDGEQGAGLFTWLDGTMPTALAESDLDEAVAFLTAVHALRSERSASDLPLASEACLSGTEVLRQVDVRLQRLLELTAEPSLRRFLRESVVPTLSGLRTRVLSWRRGHAGFAEDLPVERRTLSPSDFGFHNAIRKPEGHLAFLDFEYFGWDDPVKLTSDILLHPGHSLTERQRARLRGQLGSLYGRDDSDFSARLEAYMPLFGVRWVLILLNEFLPERWERRVRAGEGEDWEAVKSRQIGRACSLMASLGAADPSASLPETER